MLNDPDMHSKLHLFVLIIASSLSLYGQGINVSTDQNIAEDFEKLPQLHWYYKSSAPFFASPLISAGILYVGGLDSTLYALVLNSGTVKWKLKTGGEMRSSVCLAGEYLYVYSGDATLYAIQKESGKIVWTFKTKGGILGDRRYDFADYFYSSPVFHNNRIFVGAGDGRLYALNKEGNLLWSYKTNGILHTTPGIYKDRVFVGSFDGYVYALSQDTGALLWKFKTVGHRYFPEGEIQGSLVVANDLVYVGARDYNFYAIDAMSGYCHWNKAFQFGWAMAATAKDSAIYVGTSDDRVLLKLDGTTGRELWRTDVKFNVFGPCAQSNKMAYVGTLMGKLWGIDLASGKVMWTYHTPTYQEHHLNFFKPDDTFRDDITNIIKSPSDFIEMEYKLGAIFSTPAITNEFMVISSTEGTIYCLKKNIND